MSKDIEISSVGQYIDGRWTFHVDARCLSQRGCDVLIEILTVMRSAMIEQEQLGTGSESATGPAQCDTSPPAREQSGE